MTGRAEFCRKVGGDRWNTRRPWRLWVLCRRWRWLKVRVMMASSAICRFRGHAVDGQEWGGLGRDGCADVWCSRCFYGYTRVPVDSLPFAARVLDVTNMVRDAFGGGKP